MTERPILFSGPMVRAILDGNKTQTRRVVKPQPVEDPVGWFDWGYAYGAPKATSPRSCKWHSETWQNTSGSAPINVYCPYGQVGDRLWVRETWRVGYWKNNCIAVDYCADSYARQEWLHVDDEDLWTRLVIDAFSDAELAGCVDDNGIASWNSGKSPCRWRPSIHMPRWASRLTLEITEIRVQRVRDITEEDVVAEGVDVSDCIKTHRFGGYVKLPFKPKFTALWDSINAKRGFSWDSNPWVWALTFQRIEAQV